MDQIIGVKSKLDAGVVHMCKYEWSHCNPNQRRVSWNLKPMVACVGLWDEDNRRPTTTPHNNDKGKFLLVIFPTITMHFSSFFLKYKQVAFSIALGKNCHSNGTCKQSNKIYFIIYLLSFDKKCWNLRVFDIGMLLKLKEKLIGLQ